MAKADDSSLDPAQLRAVEERARQILDRADGWNRFPTPVDDVLAAAKLKVAPAGGAFDPRLILAYLQGKAERAAASLKSAIAKCLGICDVDEAVIHIDHSVSTSKQIFLKLHETGHHQIPWQQKVFRIFQDCEKTLDPEVSDLFEREANNFARFVLFQGRGYADLAADSKMEIRSPIALARKFGSSIYASCREFARTNHRSCAVYVLEPIEYCNGSGARAPVRRVEVSPSFGRRFNLPQDPAITLDHPLGEALPIGRRMTKPRSISLNDRNGDPQECVVEAFDTKFNIILLIYPVAALAKARFVVSSAFEN